MSYKRSYDRLDILLALAAGMGSMLPDREWTSVEVEQGTITINKNDGDGNCRAIYSCGAENIDGLMEEILVGSFEMNQKGK